MSGLTPKRQGRGAITKPDITNKPDDEKSLAELKRENAYLRAENAYLKKLDACSGRGNKLRQSKAHLRIKISISFI